MSAYAIATVTGQPTTRASRALAALRSGRCSRCQSSVVAKVITSGTSTRAFCRSCDPSCGHSVHSSPHAIARTRPTLPSRPMLPPPRGVISTPRPMVESFRPPAAERHASRRHRLRMAERELAKTPTR